MKDEQKAPILQALGICAKAGRLIYGTPMICEALRQRKTVCLVLAASDNSENSAKRLRDRCDYYQAPLAVLGVTGEALAHAVGKGGHLAAVAITDPELCRFVRSRLPDTAPRAEESNQ